MQDQSDDIYNIRILTAQCEVIQLENENEIFQGSMGGC